ncbi:bifunctional epoxide hydrolase 2 [Clupea harengus]|uniref:Bifunctional epoxide hydrolase 2 n=1 Tax=Clupea harengus TaxID=7950 RepID=A0A6P3VPF3_CLUHA|nr:bifunctional epoxide hydrolase 2 [Clupea harengus]
MALKTAVLFNLWGGVLTTRPSQSFLKYEKSLGLPSDVISKTLAAGGTENALVRAERGKITLQQMHTELEEDIKKEASVPGLTSPAEFALAELFREVRGADFHKPILEAAAALRRHGVTTGVLANLWVDDTPQRERTAQILSVLEGHFDLVLRSCFTGARVPEPAMFNMALEKLGLTPQQAVWLDAEEEGVKAAESLGMAGVLVQDMSTALNQLQMHTGVEVQSSKDGLPSSCRPEDATHGFVTIKPGVQIHFVEMGDGPPILLCHGFPESWFSWRYQIPALADAGFRVLVPDLKGFGDSTAPEDIEEYSQENLCQDVLTFMDKLGIPQVTLIGHDWGGALVWSLAQCHPERVRAVASLNTPLFPVDPNSDPMERLKAAPIFDYQIYFQKPGVAEAEFEKDLERTFKIFFSASYEKDKHPPLSTAKVCERGGLFVGLPEEIPRSSMLTEAALKYYVQQFRKSGFRGPLNWYRNVERNWRWMCSRPRAKILLPALMVTAGKDPVLLPVFSHGMENMIPNLTRGHIEECGHWTQMERPAELNKILLGWLKETHQKASILVAPKL